MVCPAERWQHSGCLRFSHCTAGDRGTKAKQSSQGFASDSNGISQSKWTWRIILISRGRAKQRQVTLAPQKLSVHGGVTGTASWRAQQMFPQFAIDVSLLLSATARPPVQGLDTNKLVREMRRCASQTRRCHAFEARRASRRPSVPGLMLAIALLQKSPVLEVLRSLSSKGRVSSVATS